MGVSSQHQAQPAALGRDFQGERISKGVDLPYYYPSMTGCDNVMMSHNSQCAMLHCGYPPVAQRGFFDTNKEGQWSCDEHHRSKTINL